MPSQSVRTHQRKNADGSVSTVHKHNRTGRRGRGRKKTAFRSGVLNLKKSFKYARRKKRATAIFFATVGTAQIGSFVALRGVSLVAASVAIIATAVAGIAYAASSGGKLPR